MRLIRNNFLPPKGIKAVTFGKWMLVREDTHIMPRTFNHGNIHYAQKRELLFVGFYLWYAVEFALRMLRHGWNVYAVHRCLLFEREAYANEGDYKYTLRRKPFAWLRYIMKG